MPRSADDPESIDDLPTPSLVVERSVFDANRAAMDAVLPGPRLRPHVKAFKSTAVARRLAEAGHRGFCCATTKEMTGLAAAGLGDDLLLANEVLDPGHLATLAGLARAGRARVTIAVDGDETLLFLPLAHIFARTLVFSAKAIQPRTQQLAVTQD